MPTHRENQSNVPGAPSGAAARSGQQARGYVYFEPQLRAYLAKLRAEGKALPTCLAHPDRPLLKQVRAEAGYKKPWKASLRLEAEIIRGAVVDLGLARLQPVTVDGPLTLGELCGAALAERERELAGRPGCRRETSNLKWSLNVARKAQAAGWDEAARPSLEAALAAAGPGASKLRQGLNYALDRLAVMEASGDLPDGFAEALLFAMRRQGLTIAALMREVGLGRESYLLYRWADGFCLPGSGQGAVLAAVERRLQLAPGTLAVRARKRRRGYGGVPDTIWPEAIRGNRKLMSAVAMHLPAGLVDMPEAQRAAAIEAALAKVPGRRATPQARMQADRFHLKDLGLVAEEQWAEICDFRSSAIAPLAMRRPPVPWKPGSFRINRYRLESLFGWLTGRRAEGACVAPADVTLAVLAFPSVVHGWLRWRKERTLEASGRDYITKADLGILMSAAVLVDPHQGWIGQSPQLALTLRPIPRLVSEADVAAARADWGAACKNAHATYRRLLSEMRKYTKAGRDGQDSVKPILRMPDPFVALRMLGAGLQREWQEAEPDTWYRAERVRDVVLNGIMSQCAFRAGTLRALRWAGDGTGHLRREADGWWLRVPRALFKNGHLGWFALEGGGFRDYDRRLLDVQGLYAAIEEYLGWGRGRMLGERASESLLVGHKTTGYSVAGLYKIIEAATVRHLGPAGRDGGIPGMARGFGTHAYRHVLATATLKRTSDFDLAADAIHDSVMTVREHYTCWLPEDRSNLLQSVLALGLVEA